MIYLNTDSPAAALQAYAHTANFYYTEACRNGIPLDYTQAKHSDKEERQFDVLWDYIYDGNLEAFSNFLDSESFDINYRNRIRKETLLHIAYAFNEPKFVEFLVRKGANDRILNDDFRVPLAVAHPLYQDSSPSVFKELISYCSQKILATSADIHVLFKATLDFIKSKKWTFIRSEKEVYTGFIPHGDDITLVLRGLPHLSYRVNCFGLSLIFIKVAKQFGIHAEEIKYRDYKSIKREDRKTQSITGELYLFDEKEPADSTNFEFDDHCVAYSSGWYFDLTLICKYQDKDAILTKQKSEDKKR